MPAAGLIPRNARRRCLKRLRVVCRESYRPAANRGRGVLVLATLGLGSENDGTVQLRTTVCEWLVAGCFLCRYLR